MQDFHSKVGYSYSYKKKELLCFVGACVAITALIYLFFPLPANGFLTLIFTAIFLLFLVVGLLLMRWILGVTVEIEGKIVRIRTSQAGALAPKENELYFAQKSSGACVITKENVTEARKLRPEEKIELQKSWNFSTYAGTSVLKFLMNVPTMQRLAFVTDWDNIVILRIADLKVWDPTFSDMKRMKSQKDYHLLVSVQHPDAFIAALSG
jgi:hypothetical protein